ncbi:MAG TPA: S-methyl-5-thioribose-1-phosphate isomerase [Spirochaetota bacterium]|nr:S-methyl-5-thioribose-1-phosphate isomerase [Spirochaetota bacterium]
MKDFKPTITYKNKTLYFLDQQKLPAEKIKLKISDYKTLIRAIKQLKIRGAPAIGVCGAYGVVLAAADLAGAAVSSSAFRQKLNRAAQALRAARPTAVNLSWAVNRVTSVVNNAKEAAPLQLVKKAEKEAAEIMKEDMAIGIKLGKTGASLIKNKCNYLTHCNAGGLATAGMGSALSIFYFAHKKNKNFKIYVDETRPLLQGARLTTFELKRWGIPYVLICDNMAAALMHSGTIDAVITGADRIAMNGDAANKTGTYNLAVLAKYHKLPFYIAAPYSTFDKDTARGAEIEIELRHKNELLYFNNKQIAPLSSAVYNPAFDVVPAGLISGIVTEKGIIYKPDKRKIDKFLKNR